MQHVLMRDNVMRDHAIGVHVGLSRHLLSDCRKASIQTAYRPQDPFSWRSKLFAVMSSYHSRENLVLSCPMFRLSDPTEASAMKSWY